MSQPQCQASPPEPQHFCPSTNSDEVTSLPALDSLSFTRTSIIICFLARPGSCAMGSQGLEAFCMDASYIAAFKILNLPSLAIPDSPQRLSSRPDWLGISNITTYTTGPTSILLDNFKYEVITSLPLAKPLAVQCPVPACIFPISGYFTFLQRLLLYINIAIATFALHIPLLRGVSQIWLTTFWFSVLAMYAATMATTKVPMIYNLDLQPAALVVHIGLLPTLLWFSFRAEPGEPRHHAEEIATDESWIQRWKREFSNFPVTRILVPIYAIWGLMNIILANAVQDSAGFWPKATAVILSNGTNYLLTSPCFEDPSGFVGLWPPPPSPYNGIRALNSLSIYYPPPGFSAVDALQAVPKTVLTVLHVGSVLICFIIIILSFTKLQWLEDLLHERCVTNLPPYILKFLHPPPSSSPATPNTAQV
jgi:hypothetical protein